MKPAFLTLSPKTLSSILEKFEEEMERDHMCYRGLNKGSLRYDVFATWEERAFAEDSAGDLGSIWPPRSYSCSFCGREFGSAQALGGHMNVHRRDRARLKQSQSSQSDEEAQIATDHRREDKRLPSSPISSRLDLDRRAIPRVSSLSLISDKRSAVPGDQMLVSSPNCSSLGWKHEENKGMRSLVSRSSVYPTIVEAMKNISETNRGNKLRCIGNSGKKQCIDGTTSFKRARISDSRTLPRFTLDRFFTEDCVRMAEVSRVKVGPMEELELDLELRLGSPSEVK